MDRTLPRLCGWLWDMRTAEWVHALATADMLDGRHDAGRAASGEAGRMLQTVHSHGFTWPCGGRMLCKDGMICTCMPHGSLLVMNMV